MNILVTGGASGLGAAICKLLASDGDNMVYFTFNSSVQKANEIEAKYSNTFALQCDFKNAHQVRSISNNIDQLQLDVLINNAYSGDFLKSHFHKIPAEDFATDFENNLIPTLKLTQAAIAYFRKRKKGRIITILTSGLINNAPIGSSVYMANKAYLKQMTKAWASENAKFNIVSNSVSPSFMETELTASIDERIVEQMKANHPLKRLLTVQEVAETVHFLTHSSKQINGSDIEMNDQ
jgi:3-oxoacyl-[acyl-carrier protein] reductase